MKDEKRKIAARLTVLIPLLVLLLFFAKERILELKQFFPECVFFELTGWLCPACGNTRSITALLNGHPFQSVGYNITPMLLIVLGTAGYGELVMTALGKERRIIPRNYTFLSIVLILLISYYICRNIFPFLTLCK